MIVLMGTIWSIQVIHEWIFNEHPAEDILINDDGEDHRRSEDFEEREPARAQLALNPHARAPPGWRGETPLMSAPGLRAFGRVAAAAARMARRGPDQDAAERRRAPHGGSDAGADDRRLGADAARRPGVGVAAAAWGVTRVCQIVLKPSGY